MTSTPHVVDLGFVNAYLLTTDAGFILVDTGMRSQRGALENALASAGCQPGGLKLIVATHGDIDHTANCAYLRETFQAPVALHPADSSMVKAGVWPHRRVTSRSLRLIHLVMRFSGATKRMTGGFERFTPDLELAEGQSLRAYGLDATVLHLPGHTPGSICLLLGGGELVCGDTLENRGGLHPTRIVDDETALVASLERLATLGITTVYPGHGHPFSWGQFETAHSLRE
jgi:glyoxylase-like metal-dependent hydrolase (beta-lactamase superfamily II)